MIAQKFRPRRFTDMVGQQLIKENLMAQSKKNCWSQVYILGGQYGSGKTTAARIISMAVNCHSKDENGNPCGKCESCRSILSGNCPDIMEVDAASNTGIDNIRRIIDLSGYAPTTVDKRVFIIDEVHRLSPAAFESLLKILEEPPAHCMFVLATTDVEKIPATVRSRACKYTFGRIPEKLISEHIMRVARVEGITINKEACDTIARASDGALRNALMNLERVSFSSDNIDADAVRAIIGTTDEESIGRLLWNIGAFNMEEVANMVHSLAYGGKNLYTLSNEMLDVCGDLILFKSGQSLTASDSYIEVLKGFDGGLKKVALLSEQLLEVREHTRDNASEGAFLSLLMRAIVRLEAQLQPKREEEPKVVVADSAPAATESERVFVPETASEPAAPCEEMVPGKEAASVKAMQPTFDDPFDSFDDFEPVAVKAKSEPQVSDDPFDAMESLPVDVPFEQEEKAAPSEKEEPRPEYYPFNSGKVVERNGKKYIVTDEVNYPIEIAESSDEVPFEEREADCLPKRAPMLNADEMKKYPEFLRNPKEGCSKEVERALQDLIGVCRQEPELAEILGSFKCDTECGIVCLETDDRLAFRQAASIVRGYDIPNVDFITA